MIEPLPGWAPGTMRVSGSTERPKVTMAIADPKMPRGQEWVVRGGDYPVVEHIPRDQFVVLYSPEDPEPLLDV